MDLFTEDCLLLLKEFQRALKKRSIGTNASLYFIQPKCQRLTVRWTFNLLLRQDNLT